MHRRGFSIRSSLRGQLSAIKSDTCAGGPSPTAAQDDRSRQHGHKSNDLEISPVPQDKVSGAKGWPLVSRVPITDCVVSSLKFSYSVPQLSWR
jgi:hypothetical protein